MVRMTGKPKQDNVVTMRRMGRPPINWTPDLEEFILSLVIAGRSLRQIVEEGKQTFGEKAFPSDALIKIHLASTPEFLAKYVRAKDVAQDLMAEDIVDIMDGRLPGFETADLDQRKASAEIRKWVMGKLRRKKWGDVKVTEVTGGDGQPLIPPQVIDTRSLPPEAQAALYQALQLIKAQQEAEDISHTTEEST